MLRVSVGSRDLLRSLDSRIQLIPQHARISKSISATVARRSLSLIAPGTCTVKVSRINAPGVGLHYLSMLDSSLSEAAPVR